ncbi:Peptidase M [Parasponia andersonii]|uniref:Peptidase M n=1 Tax=Parasponia andersonii TaxID=3476 RepID=A0A2P5BWU4_PARAD|nr:Peptidase M [Parasponia andersonii]
MTKLSSNLEGHEPGLAAVATGSHIDAIPYSGKYDGVVGVLGGIEAINVLKRSGFKPKRSLEVILFTSEEPTRFGISCLGSRLLAGSEALAKALKTMVDGQNVSFFDAARSAGYAKDQDDLSIAFLKKETYTAFVELHIEQGPILEEEGISIGIVTAIAAPASIKVEFEGNGGHAGAVLMPNRNDAGLAAAELALAVERHVLESRSVDSVGTVGILELHPGAINSIPSKSHLQIGANLAFYSCRISPMGMIFIPCYKGYSHKPEEFSSIDDISNGVKVLALTLAKFSLE